MSKYFCYSILQYLMQRSHHFGSDLATNDEDRDERRLLVKQTISAAEWQVMRVLWANPGRSSQEIILALQEGFDWQASTIKTLLGRLKAKQYLKMEKKEGKYRYYPLVEEEQHIKEQVQILLAGICSTKQVHLIELILETGHFSKKQLNQLARNVQQLEKTAPTSLSCHCLSGQCTCGSHQKGVLE